MRKVHLIGVGGVGMSALAEVLVHGGVGVTGSDRSFDCAPGLPTWAVLQSAGIRLVPQDGSGVVPGLDAVVYSTAVEADNPDLKAAASRGIPCRHRSEILAERTASSRCLAVAGTSGKTTVTGMLGWMLEYAGLDPWVINGGSVRDWRSPSRTGHTRKGGSDLWILEADESDRSLLRLSPEWAVLTTVSADHFPEEETRNLFRSFLARVRSGIVAPRAVREELGGAYPWVVADSHGFSPRLGVDGCRFRYAGLSWTVPLPGAHNAWNARLAAAACRLLGCDMRKARDALARFGGIHRRLETVSVGPVRILDDYAHNPEKIRAAWTAAAAYGGRLTAVWRPHGYGPLRNMRAALHAVFCDLCRPPHRLYLLPVYYAGGTAQPGTTSADLAEDLARCRVPVEAIEGYDELRTAIRAHARPGDTVLLMGARDPELPRFARSLADELNLSGLA